MAKVPPLRHRGAHAQDLQQRDAEHPCDCTGCPAQSWLLNLKRSENGRLRDDDLLALLAIYGEARGVEARSSVTTLRYNDHKLELTCLHSMQQRQCSPNGSRAAV